MTKKSLDCSDRDPALTQPCCEGGSEGVQREPTLSTVMVVETGYVFPCDVPQGAPSYWATRARRYHIDVAPLPVVTAVAKSIIECIAEANQSLLAALAVADDE